MFKIAGKKFIGAVLSFSMLAFLSVPVSEAKDLPKLESVYVEELDGTVKVRDMTREEYVKSLAEEENISYGEADKLEKEQTRGYLEEQTIKSKKENNQIEHRGIVYKQVNKIFNVATGKFKSKIQVTVHVKLNRFVLPSQGTHQKFVQVLDKGVLPSGSGKSTFQKGAFSTAIRNESSMGNELYMMVSGNIEHVVSYSYTASANAAGFSVSGSAGGNYYCRKFITKNYTFNSNWDLS